jgi:hypothetical protein
VNEERFWTIVEASRRAFRRDQRDGNMDRQLRDLKLLLLEQSVADVVEFDKIMTGLLWRAYTWELWGAAHIVGEGGCSDDNFTDFRSWLISMGRDVYEQALADADSLAEYAYAPEVEDCFFEEFAYVTAKVLEVNGTKAPEMDERHPDQPSGRDWRDDEGELALMFPKLWARAQSHMASDDRATTPAPRRAILIDPKTRAIAEIAMADGGYPEIRKLIGCPWCTTAAYLNGSFAAGFDCITAGNDAIEDRQDRYWFQVDAGRDPPASLPIAGKGLVHGVGKLGETIDAGITIEELAARITFTERF